MAKAIDIGTSFLVGAEMKNGQEYFTSERDAFFAMPKEDFAEEMLGRAGGSYLTKGNMLFVIGEDALKFSMLTGNHKDYRRPMAKGILNPGEEEAISMLEKLIEGVVGKASSPGEVIAATVPASPIDSDLDVTFHRIVVERCLRRLGYEPKIINEAMGIVYYDNPSSEDDGESIPFTGIGISFGAGMTNLVVSWRAKKLFEISVARGGDWIDSQVAQVRGLPVSKVTHVKEKRLDLASVDPKDPVQLALEIYYEELIRYTLESFAHYFQTSSSDIDCPLDIVIAGGTASVPGFVDKFRNVLEAFELPIQVRDVRLSKDSLRAPAGGALVAALSMERRQAPPEKALPTPPDSQNRLSRNGQQSSRPVEVETSAES
ncbi:MAG: hypothetical protein RL885_28980 [Planctomycetota bacterium]